MASGSRWRAELLAMAGLQVQQISPDVDESVICDPDPTLRALRRARAKATAVALQAPGALIIGADQVAHLDGECFGKPRDTADWMARLQQLRGRTHWLTTGVVLLDAAAPLGQEGAEESFSVTTAVRFRADLTDDEIRAYITHGEAAGCAGGYMIERRGAWLIESVDGDWLNVIGLPVLPLITALRRRGWRLHAP